MFIMAKTDRRSSPIEFIPYVFNRRSVEKDCSHDATITGYVTKTLKSQYVTIYWHVTIYANRMDARRSQFDLGRVDAYI